MKSHEPRIEPRESQNEPRPPPKSTNVNVNPLTETNKYKIPSSSLSFISWNVNGLTDKLGYPHVISELTSHDIIFLSETWLDINNKATDEEEYDIPGYSMTNIPRSYIHEKALRCSGGVILYIKQGLTNSVQVIQELCDHFIVACVTQADSKLYIIFSYIPPYDTPHFCKTCDGNYMESLYELYVNYSSKGHVYICGDLNSRTGIASDMPMNYLVDDFFCEENDPFSNLQIYDNELETRHSMDKTCNTQGRSLLNMLRETDMRIVNGRHSHDKGVGRFTYIRGEACSVIDYLLAQSPNFGKIVSFKVCNKEPESDHCPISFTLECDIPTTSPKPNEHDTPKYSKFKWDRDSLEKFHEKLSDTQGLLYAEAFYDSIESLESPEVVSHRFCDLISQAADRALTKSKPHSDEKHFPVNKWFDSECKTAKADLHKAEKCPDIPKPRLRHLRKEYDRIIQKKKRKLKIHRTRDILSARNPTEMWKKLDALSPKRSKATSLTLQDFKDFYSKPAVNSDNNSHNFDSSVEEEILKFIQTYQSDPNNASVYDSTNCDNIPLIQEVLDSVITADEITSALQNLKKGKSPGADGIPIDLFIDCEKSLNPLLCDLFNYILENESYPADWALGLINPVHKGGSDSVENFRKISILPAISKILENVMNTRLEFVDNALKLEDPFNGGFKKNSRTTDNIFVLNSLIDQAAATNTPLYVCFVDFRRAFDCVNRNFMFFKLIKQGYSSKTLRLIMSMYSKTKGSVKLHGHLSGSFEEILGVAQGGILSPYLFKSFLKDMSKIFSDMYGIQIDDELTLCYLLWADDLVLFSHTPQGLQDHLDKLHQYCAKWQLIVNNLKTKVLIFSKKRIPCSATFTIGGSEIEIATKYKYLGTLYSTVKQVDETIAYITNNCSRALYKIRTHCKELGQLPPSTALELFDSLIAPLLDYGSEIWYRDSIAKRLETLHLRYLKRILKVRQQTPTLAVYGELGRYPLNIRLRCNVLKYLHRAYSFSSDSIHGRVVKMLCRLKAQGKANWLTKAESVFNDLQLSTNITMDIFLSKSESSIKTLIKNSLQKEYAMQWECLVKDINKQPKLRTYCTFKTNIKLEPYLSLVIPKQRMAISRFRCSAHHLHIETGRHHKPKIPVDNRTCSECKVLEDEMHHLIHCVKNKDPRKDLFITANSIIENFCDMPPSVKFNQLMECENLKLQKAIAIFLIESSK